MSNTRMTNTKKISFLKAIIFSSLLLAVNLALANPYVGFQLCKDSEEDARAVIEKSGGDSDRYPIATGHYKVEMNFYDEKLLSISIKEPENLSELLKEKYGTPKQTKVRGSGSDIFFDEFFDKKNKNVKIENIWAIYRNMVIALELKYTCKSLSLKKEADEKKLKADEFKLKNTGKQI